MFFSYSTAEPTNVMLSTLIWVVFHEQYQVRLTPSALTSGASQLQEIERQIASCALGVVCLDGLRPNVIHEYGYMRGRNKPVILLKTEKAKVDIRHFIREAAPELENPTLNMDVHLSNLKDIHHAGWYPDDPPKSAKAVWEEYNKVREQFPDAKLMDVETVTVDMAIGRLKSIAGVTFTANDETNLLSLRKTRNAIEDYKWETTLKEAKIIVANALSFAISFAQDQLNTDLTATFKKDDTWETLLIEFNEFIHAHGKRLEAKRMENGGGIPCDSCGYLTLVPGGGSCDVCGHWQFSDIEV